MACAANETTRTSTLSVTGSESTPSSSEATNNSRKRCSLPGPMGSLNLYTTHQQRRLSERGLMAYRPSRPDIDLIGDFINPGKKSMNLGPSTSALPLQFQASSSFSPVVNILPTITSPNRSNSLVGTTSIPSNGGNSCLPSGSSSITNRSTITNPQLSGCRKVRILIQKSAGGKENKFVEMETIPTSSGRSASVSDEGGRGGDMMLLHHPMFDSRRFSDSVTFAPPKISISLTTDGNDAGIICSTGDLRALKCLTSSAQEIRFTGTHHPSSTSSSTSGSETTTPDTLGNRSRSFDATSTGTTASHRKGIGSSWFTRRHIPISAKLPLPLKSPSVPNSPGPNQLIMKTPILTVTNETSGQSELIEVPSPPASTPLDPHGNVSDLKTKVAWDQSGFLVDAAVLGSVIENHLRKTDMKRRATVSTLYEPPNSLDQLQVTTRARSASACTIPTIGVSDESMLGISSGGGLGLKPITFLSAINPQYATNNTTNNNNRRSSLKTDPCGNGLTFGRSKPTSPSPPKVGEGDGRRPSKRFSISGPSTSSHGPIGLMSSTTSPPHGICSPPAFYSGPDSCRPTESFVETIDSEGRVTIVKTSTCYNSTPFSYTVPPIQGRINTKDELDDENRRRNAYYKKVNTQHTQGTGLSICSIIRDFIFHSLK